MLEGTLIIAVDFDGTITTEKNMGKTLKLQPNVEEFLHRIESLRRVKLILWTCRTGKYLDEATDFLDCRGLLALFSEVNEQLPEIRKLYPDCAKKVGADLYIDDRNILSDINWENIYTEILSVYKERFGTYL